MKLAHYSDLHVSHFPLDATFALKRLAAVASYSLSGRGAHFHRSHRRIAALLDDVDAETVDHSLCTGDLTGVSGTAEFQVAADLFGERRNQPERYTCIPGNHDRYVTSAMGLFEHHFGRRCDGGQFPLMKKLSAHVTLVAIDVCRPTNLIHSTGRAGADQLKALGDMLTHASLSSQFVILALHYGLLRHDGRRDRPSHRLTDDRELQQLIDRSDVHLDIVVHGHLHRPYVVRTQRRVTICAGSATDLHTACGYNIYHIDAQNHRLRIERRNWSVVENRYFFDVTSSLNQTLQTR